MPTALPLPLLPRSTTGTGYTITFVARWCSSYSDIIANRSRNNLQENLGQPDSASNGRQQYTFTENVPSGWSLSGVSCTNRSNLQWPANGDPNTFSVTVLNGGTQACTVTDPLAATGGLVITETTQTSTGGPFTYVVVPAGGLSAAPTATNQNACIDVMRQTLGDPRYADLNLVDVVYGNDDDLTSQEQSLALLESHPSLRVIVSPTTVGIAAAAQVLKATGAAGTVQLTGLGTPNSMQPYVKDGTVKEFPLWNVENLGYLSYYVAAKLSSGEIEGNPGETFSVPTLGDYTIGDDSVVVLRPPEVFTADNIDQFDF